MDERTDAEYRELIDGLDAIVWEANPETLQFTFVSRCAESVLGYPTTQWLEEPGFLANYLHPQDRDETIASLLDDCHPERGCVLEYRVIASDGSVRWLRNVVSARVCNGRRVGLKGVMIDVTHSRRAAKEEAEARDRLAWRAKMEALVVLAGGVAHDFNNVLTAVQGYSDLTLHDLDAESPFRWNLEQILSSSERGASLNRQLLLFSRRCPVEPISLSVSRVVENLVEMPDQIAGDAVTILTELQSDLWMVNADPRHIERALRSLVSNAVDAMPDGGTVTIKTENLILSQELAQVMPDARPGRFVRLSVVDTGTGMTEGVKAHLFEPFFTTKPRTPGKSKGLGLPVVYGIVTQHQGWLNVVSQPGQGTTVEVYLPADDQA